MKEYIIKPVKWFFAFLDNCTDGISGRKLVAYFLCWMVYKLDMKYIDLDGITFNMNFLFALLIHIVFIAFFLGLIAWQQVESMKNILPGGGSLAVPAMPGAAAAPATASPIPTPETENEKTE